MYTDPREARKVQARKQAVHAANEAAKRRANLLRMATVAQASKGGK